MLKMVTIVVGLSVSLLAQAEMTLTAECSSMTQSKSKADAVASLVPVQGLQAHKAAQIANIDGKVFSISVDEANEWSPFPDFIYLTVKDGNSEINSASMPGPCGEAWVSASVKSAISGGTVSVSCKVRINEDKASQNKSNAMLTEEEKLRIKLCDLYLKDSATQEDQKK